MSAPLAQHVRCMVNPPVDLAVDVSPSSELTFTTPTLPAGIYRVSALIDASAFDWERLFFPMKNYGNQGQRTGPWDFDFEGFKPLVPAWWVHVNDERLGLAIVARPSPAQLRTRIMTLAWCFELANAGPAHIRLVPFQPANVTALDMVIEPEPFDRISSQELPLINQHGLALEQVRSGELARLASLLKDQSSTYSVTGEKSLAWARSHPDCSETLPLLALAHRELNDPHAGEIVADQVRRWIALPHWGNPDEAGYGHDADMGVASVIEPLSILYHWSEELLRSQNLHQPLLQKLQLQMKRFYAKLLLSAEYWGGSLLQDHGHRSVSRFGVAAMNLLGVLPEAPGWTRFVHQRMVRVLTLLPDDGSIPFSSYTKVHLYMDDMTSYRDALLHVSGRDLFSNPMFQRIIQFVANRLDQDRFELACVSSRGDRKDFYAGWGFSNAIAARHHDHTAAELTRLLLKQYETRLMAMRPAATFLQALGHHDPKVEPQPIKAREFDYRPQAGLVDYRPATRDVHVAMRCVLPGGAGTGQTPINPCDRVKDAPLEGHFSVHVRGQALLLTAEGGYRMRAGLGSVLLVDGRGGFGDDDFAMGMPGLSDRGERIISTWHDPASGQAYVRMRLDQAYPRELGLLQYTREFQLQPSGMRVRDHVVARASHHFSWRFHTYARRTIDACPAVPDTPSLKWKIQDEGCSLTLAAHAVDQPLLGQIKPTEIVWGYQNENNSQEFKHIDIQAIKPCSRLTVDFTINW